MTEKAPTAARDDVDSGARARDSTRRCHAGQACVDDPARDVLLQSHLNQLVEAEIMPRLMLAHTLPLRPSKLPNFSAPLSKTSRSGPAKSLTIESSAVTCLVPTSEQIERLRQFAVSGDLVIMDAYVRSLSEEGMAEDTILLDLISPAARRLGDMWDADELDFMAVSMGMVQLEQLVHRISRRSATLDNVAMDRNYRVLLVTPPEEQHTFGLLLLSEFFRQAGWFVRTETRTPLSDLRAILKSQFFTVVGVSCSRDCQVDDLCHAMAGLRRASCNPALLVLVGGASFTADPSLAKHVGADGAAADASDAVAIAGELANRVAAASRTIRSIN